jgi:hypothetical protein
MVRYQYTTIDKLPDLSCFSLVTTFKKRWNKDDLSWTPVRFSSLLTLGPKTRRRMMLVLSWVLRKPRKYFTSGPASGRISRLHNLQGQCHKIFKTEIMFIFTQMRLIEPQEIFHIRSSLRQDQQAAQFTGTVS